LKIDTEQNQTKDQKKKICRPLQRDLLLKMPNKTQTKHQKKELARDSPNG
jgi:hypothetical protein